MFEKLKTIFRGKDAGPAADKGPPRERVISKVTGTPMEKSWGDEGRLKPLAGVTTPETPAPVAAPAPASVPAPASTPPKPQKDLKPQISPEEICGVNPRMSKDEVKERLAVLYRRYNRATSSLDAKLRAESEDMLDAIVAVREKVFGPI